MEKLINTFQKRHLLASLFLLFAITAQCTIYKGEIRGTVTDEKGEGLPGAAVQVITADGKTTGQGAAADMDGSYSISHLAPGKYTIKTSSLGYISQIINNVMVSDARPAIVNIQLHAQAKELQSLIITQYKKPLIDRADTKLEQYVMDIRPAPAGRPSRNEKRKSISQLSVDQIAAGAAGVTQTDMGRNMGINGGRPDETQYIVNGHRIIGKPASQPEYDMAPIPMPYPMPDDMMDSLTAETHKGIIDNPFLSAGRAPLSTFSIDVDVASYGITRKKISDGMLPPRDAVRIEEMINYFPYSYADPVDGRPFAVHTELADCPWDATHKLLRIGIQGKHIAEAELPPSNLVFLIDVSGSMMSYERLPLIQKSLGMLTDRMRPQDHIALVAYAGNAGLVLPSTSGAEKDKIKAAINNLTAGGSTAGGAGIELAYKVAVDNFIKGGNNRVLLCTDGDFNVGISGETALTAFIEEKRKTGVFLSVLGVGTGNYKDAEMEALADKGNGNYAYIDNEKEAKKNLVTQMGGTLHTIAKDVKIQAVFNPTCVKSYRLIGYENRKLENSDFSNDKIDAGEIGAGTAVTALYEVVLGTERQAATVPLEDNKDAKEQITLSAADLMALRIRYKAPDGEKSQLIESHVSVNAGPLVSASDDFRFAAAVASFGMLLRDSPYRGDYSYDKAKALAKAAAGADQEGYRSDFIRMIGQAHKLDPRTASK